MLSSKRRLNFDSENFDTLSNEYSNNNYKKFKNSNNINYYSNKPLNRFKENEDYFNFSLNEKTNNINNSSKFLNKHFFNKPKDICRKLNFLDEENSNTPTKNNENNFNNLTSNNNNNYSTYQNTTDEKNKNCIIIDDNFSVSSFKNNSYSNENEEEEKNDFLFIRKQSSTSLSLNYNKFDEEYVAIKTLNKGEQGVVFLCMKFQDKLPYVVKTTNFFSSKNDYKNMTNFVNIMNNLKNLPISEYILRYIDFWIENNKDLDDEIFFENKNNKKIKNLYIVNKYLPNGNLTDYINSLKISNFNFTENFYWDVFFEMMCGVLFIHKMGYIHFDIKPTNFLVDENGKILLNDFCLSRPENDLDSFDEIEGDSIYLSLEVFKKKNISQKSDLFSLGLSIFEILTDFKLPKNGDLWQEIRYNKIPENLLNLNMKFKNLILILTNVNPSNRIDIENIFNDNINFPELYYRYILLNNGNYVRNFNPSLWKEFKNENSFDFSNFNSHNAFTKRSDSMKMK